MAAEKVFLLPELFEPILASLPQRDLLQAQRVSRGWNQFIANSKQLQRKLFFQVSRALIQPETDVTVEVNPVLKELFPTFFVGSKYFNDIVPEEQKWVVDDGHVCLHHYGGYYHIAGARIIRDQPWYKDETRRKAVLNADASWRRMYLSNPPGRIIELEVDMPGCGCSSDHLDGRLCERYQAMNRNPGPRMGLVWDVVAFVLDDLPRGEFGMWWWRWRHGKNTERRMERWYLGWHIKTSHSWDCYEAREAYGPSGLKVVDDGDIVEYKDYDKYKGDITRREAPPNSVLEKFVRRTKAAKGFNDRLGEALKANAGSVRSTGDHKASTQGSESDERDSDSENDDSEGSYETSRDASKKIRAYRSQFFRTKRPRLA